MGILRYVALGLLAAAAAVAVADRAEAATGGPDAFAMVWTDQISSTFYQWQSVANQSSIVPADNVAYLINFPAGFTFSYYGTSYTSLYAMDNGYVTFGSAPANPAAFGTNIPNAADPNNMLAPFSTNHDPACAGHATMPPNPRIYSGTWGTAPKRTFIVQWDGIPVRTTSGGNCSDLRNSFELKLYEGTDIAEFHHLYSDPRGQTSAGATITTTYQARSGFEDAAGTVGLQIANSFSPAWTNRAHRLFRNDLTNVNNQAVSTPLNTAVAVTLSVSNDPMEFTLVSGPTSGSLLNFPTAGFTYRWAPNPVTYTPNTNFCGSDAFTYTGRDGITWANATVSITVPCAGAPNSVLDNYTTLEDTVLTVAAPGVLSNDNHPQGFPMTVSLIAPPPASQGTVVLNPNGSFTFTPAANFCGIAVFTYRASDGSANGAITPVGITVTCVNDAPTVTGGLDVSVVEDAGPQSSPWATLSPGPANEATQTLTVGATAAVPSLFSVQPSVSLAGVLTFQGAADAFGSSLVTVTVQDSGDTANGGQNSRTHQFTITLRPVNDAPSFNVGPTQNILHDAGAQSVPGFASGFSPGPANEAGQTLTIGTSAAPSSLFSVQPTVGLDGTLAYAPALGQQGAATVTTTVNDGGGTTDGGVEQATRTFQIRVGVPPTANDDAYDVPQGASVALDVLANDVDPHGDMLTATPLTMPSEGSLVGLVYTAPTGFIGTTSFDYEARDPFGAVDTATVTITVIPPPPPTVALDPIAQSCATVPATYRAVATGPGRTVSHWVWIVSGVAQQITTAATETTHPTTPATAGSVPVRVEVHFTDAAMAFAERTHSVIACAPPTAGFTAAPDGLRVQFTDASSGGDGSIVSRTWSFGDGATSTQSNPVRTYGASGTYRVQLTVVASTGLQASTEQVLDIVAPPAYATYATGGGANAAVVTAPSQPPAPVNRPPVARAIAELIVVGGDVRLDASASHDPDGDALRFAWVQVDGPAVAIQRANEAMAAFRPPTQAGILRFTVTVSDAQGNDTATVEYRSSAPPRVAFTADTTPHGVAFTAQAPPGAEVTWDFGDGGKSTSRAPLHRYAPGSYRVTMTVMHAGVESMATDIVTVEAAAPVAMMPADRSIDNRVAPSEASEAGHGRTVAIGAAIAVGALALLSLGAASVVMLRRR